MLLSIKDYRRLAGEGQGLLHRRGSVRSTTTRHDGPVPKGWNGAGVAGGPQLAAKAAAIYAQSGIWTPSCANAFGSGWATDRLVRSLSIGVRFGRQVTVGLPMTKAKAESATRGEFARSEGGARQGRRDRRTTWVFRRFICGHHREAPRLAATVASGKLPQRVAPGRLCGAREGGP